MMASEKGTSNRKANKLEEHCARARTKNQRTTTRKRKTKQWI